MTLKFTNVIYQLISLKYVITTVPFEIKINIKWSDGHDNRDLFPDMFIILKTRI